MKPKTRKVQAYRDGKEVFYSVVDPYILKLLEQGVRLVREE